MVTITRNPLRLTTFLFTAISSLQATLALDFTIQSVNCTQLSWTLTLSPPEWSVASYVELFFISTQNARNYSLLYSASASSGGLPSPATYDMVTRFGDTRLSEGYRIGVGLADTNGNVLTTSTSSSSGGVQVTAIDGRIWTFGNCVAGAAG
ncbi:hypothetical protein, partial [Sporisorium scitamineum]